MPRRPCAAGAVTLALVLFGCDRPSVLPDEMQLDAARLEAGGDDEVRALDDVATAIDVGPLVPPTPYEGPDDECPGRAHCAGEGDRVLYVGAARELINPTLTETAWQDRNGDNHYSADEPFTDVNGNGVFDAHWIAGFSSGRPATGQHDDLEARALAFRSGDTTVALVVLDVVGYFRDDADRIVSHPSLAGLDVDRVIVASTHVHEGVDTVGIWGRSSLETGRKPEYMALTYERAARAVRRAVESLRPATMRVVQAPTVDPATGDTRAYVNDVRDPVLYDPTVTLVRFTERDAPSRTIATWVHWSSHPEYAGSRNNQLSADYVHTLRAVIEEGDREAGVAGLGGTAVFQNGALGGQIGPGGGVAPVDRAGVAVREPSLARAEAAGRSVALLALRALEARGVDETRDLAVRYRTAPIYARVQNAVYHLGFRFGVLSRELFGFDRRRPASGTNVPWVRSRVTFLQVGPVAMLSAPGELHPDLWIGTSDLQWSWGQPVFTEPENRADLSRAPAPPYLRELVLANPGVRYAFVGGLTEDFLGYIVPEYNYVLHPTSPYLMRAAGDHYEETNSIGPDAEQHLYRPMALLAQWRPAGLDAGVADASADAGR